MQDWPPEPERMITVGVMHTGSKPASQSAELGLKKELSDRTLDSAALPLHHQSDNVVFQRRKAVKLNRAVTGGVGAGGKPVQPITHLQ